MIDKYFSWNIDGVQANTVLNGMDITLPIDEKNYRDIFCNIDIVRLLEANKDYFKLIFDVNNEEINSYVTNEFSLSYMSKDGFYYFGYDYNKVFTNILRKLDVSKPIIEEMKLPTRINSTIEANTFINEITRAIKKEQDIRESLPFEIYDHEFEKGNLLDIIYYYIRPVLRNLISTEYQIKKLVDTQIEEEKILRNNHKTLNKVAHKSVIWKNLMYYTACKSLDIFDETNDMKYYKYSKNYYKNVSTNSKCEMPKSIIVNGNYYDCWHNSFNQRFLSIQKVKFPEILVRLGIEDKDTITYRETLKKGNGMKGIITEGSKPKKKIDYSKINDTLARKIVFYKGLSGKVQGIIDGFETDTDYIGYVLPNNYVIFDKFYELSKDGTKANPAYGNRVYIVTLDVLEACGRDKQKIGKYISENHDYKAFRYNHTDADSYQRRINEVLEYSDVSTIKFKDLKLLKEKRD